MRFIVVLFLIISTISLNKVHARGGSEVGNGGDEVALQFYAAATAAINIVEREFRRFPELRVVNLRQALSEVRVVVSQENSDTTFGDILQIPVAKNYPESRLIVINRQRWLMIEDKVILQALALHEILGILGYEGTGVYTYSARFLSLMGRSLDPSIFEGAELPAQCGLDDFTLAQRAARAAQMAQRTYSQLLSQTAEVSSVSEVLRSWLVSEINQDSILRHQIGQPIQEIELKGHNSWLTFSYTIDGLYCGRLVFESQDVNVFDVGPTGVEGEREIEAHFSARDGFQGGYSIITFVFRFKAMVEPSSYAGKYQITATSYPLFQTMSSVECDFAQNRLSPQCKETW